MDVFILCSIFFTGLIILGGFCFRKNFENKNWRLNSDHMNNNETIMDTKSEHDKKDSENKWNDFLDFSGGTLGI